MKVFSLPKSFSYKGVAENEHMTVDKEMDIDFPHKTILHNHRKPVILLTLLVFIQGIIILGGVVLSLKKRGNREIIREIRGFVPEVPYQYVVFRPDAKFAKAPSEETNAAWNSLAPPGGGFIRVEDPKKYNLPPGIPMDAPDWSRYSISMFHQIHCLALLRTNYYLTHSSNHTAGDYEPGEGHFEHCFDFLRQGIMCAGDTTLEQNTPDGQGPGKPGVDGWGNTHRCANWDVIWEFVLEHTASQDEVSYVH